MEVMDRLIRLEGTFNFRDYGGYNAGDGKKVKKGSLYRSDDLSRLTIHDIDLLKKLGINTIIDFRNEFEKSKRPDKIIPGAKYYSLSPESEITSLASSELNTDKKKIDRLLEEDRLGLLDNETDSLKESMLSFVNEKQSQEVYKNMLAILGKREGIVSIQHCRGGKDRTGFGTALVLLLLGVSENDVISDYMLTAKFNKDRNHKRMEEYRQYTNNPRVLQFLQNAMSTREEVIVATIEEMKRLSGGTLNYIQQFLDVSDISVEKFRSYYLE